QNFTLSPLTPFKLGLIGNGTLDFLAPALIASAARHGIALECVQAEYGVTLQEALDTQSRINQARPDAVLLVIDHRGLPLRFETGSREAEAADAAAAANQLSLIRRSLRANSGALSIVQTLAPPPESLFGSFDRLVPGTRRRVIEAVNRAIADSMA